MANIQPLITNLYTMKVYINGTQIEIMPNMFSYFIIYEMLKYNMTYAILGLKDLYNKLKTSPFATGEKVKIEIEMSNLAKDKYSDEFIIINTELVDGIYECLLLPKIFYDMKTKNLTVGYNNNFTSIVTTIMNNIQSKTGTDIDECDSPSALYLQLSESYFDFIRANYQESCYGDYADYSFFINKDSVLKLKSINNICSGEEPIDYISDFSVISNFNVSNNNISYQLAGGSSSIGYYWDWDNGDIVSYALDYTEMEDKFKNMLGKTSKKLGIEKNFVNEQNDIWMLNPIAQDILRDEEYNKKELQNMLLRKNLFGIFVNFQYPGNLKYTPLKLINLSVTNIASSTPFDGLMSGNYICYNAIHMFFLDSYQCNLTLTTPFLFDTNDDTIKI